jgi:hypothetical protein
VLWPRGAARPEDGGRPALPADSTADLQVAELMRVLASGEGRPARRDRRERVVRQALTGLCTDPTIIAYRQELVAELLRNQPLRERLIEALPGLEALAEIAPTSRFQVPDESAVQRIARRLGDLELFVETTRQLEWALDASPRFSDPLDALREYVVDLTSSPTFVALDRELPVLRATLSQARSITIGVNLTPDLLPESATILGVSEEPVEGPRTLLGKLLGGFDAGRGITPLQRGGAGFGGQPNRLTRDLNRLLEDVAAPVGRALERFATLPTETLAGLGSELSLLLNGALLVERLGRAGLPMCRPAILPADDRMTEIVDGYDISLALRMHRDDGSAAIPSLRAPSGNGMTDGAAVGLASIIANAVTFDDATARVWILTGPNGAGKTTYTRAVGLAHLLFQAGLYVPGRSARMSPVDAIYTHFPSQEQAQPGMGRLDEEAERLAGIFKQATPHSLVLLNETLAGTAASEAEAIARDALRGLRLLGARAIYVTHLHDLARAVDEINATTPGASRVGSLVADAEDATDPGIGDAEPADDSPIGAGLSHRRTFRIHPGVPRGQSYASDIARRYGISFAQLAVLLRERGISADSPGMTTDPSDVR